jgi:uncharacterized protein (UPF0333 family)
MRGQAAFEYLMIFSIVIVLLLALVMYAGDMTTRNQEDLKVSNTISVVNEIAESANIVRTQGRPSQVTLDSIYIPDGVESINITGNMILMKVRISSGTTDVFAISKATMVGSISASQGIKRIRIRAEETYVNITEV